MVVSSLYADSLLGDTIPSEAAQTNTTSNMTFNMTSNFTTNLVSNLTDQQDINEVTQQERIDLFVSL